MKPIGISIAQRCENALEDRCECRCGGKLHGAKRGSVTSLPFNDPHSPARDCPRCNGRGETVYIDRHGGDPVYSKCDKCGGGGKIVPPYPKNTLGYHHAHAVSAFGKASAPVKFLEKKAADSPMGMSEKVVASEEQVIRLLREMWQKEQGQVAQR